MLIGVDASRAFLENRTGIEEYSYQVIRNLAYGQTGLTDKLNGHQIFLYLRKNQEVDFDLPENWSVKKINCPRLWTQVGLSLEMLLSPVDALFVPAHTVPFIHPKKTIVTVHGLEYEFCPKAYSFWERIYMRSSIRNSCRWANRIISVSENTKKDLVDLYGISSEKIDVIYEGYEKQHTTYNVQHTAGIQKPYLLFIGRIEERKNISNIVKAFEILKEKYEIPHKLVLAGKTGHNYENIKLQIANSKFNEEIKELGFVSEEEKWELLKEAEIFVFPTQYEGFGIPVLEAQSMGCPVVAANNSSIPEVTGKSALLVDPNNAEEIAQNIYKLLSDKALNDDIIKKGLENVKRFSWEKCAREVAEVF